MSNFTQKLFFSSSKNSILLRSTETLYALPSSAIVVSMLFQLTVALSLSLHYKNINELEIKRTNNNILSLDITKTPKLIFYKFTNKTQNFSINTISFYVFEFSDFTLVILFADNLGCTIIKKYPQNTSFLLGTIHHPE